MLRFKRKGELDVLAYSSTCGSKRQHFRSRSCFRVEGTQNIDGSTMWSQMEMGR